MATIPRRIKSLEFITNKHRRKVTSYKREKGIVKKSIEMSILCGLDIGLFIVDKEKNKLVYYINSESTFLNP